MERYIAIDNVCAWPNLTPMPDGRIVATIFNQPCHGMWEGDAECWESADGGRFWKLCGVPAPHEPGTNRMNVAAGLARDGSLIAIVSGWSNRPKKGNPKPASAAAGAHVIPAWVCRSADGGRTWQRREGAFPAPQGKDVIVPFGKVIQLPDGALGVCAYAGETSWFCRSRDDGRTWGDPAPICTGHNETDPLCPDGKRLLAAARSSGLDLFASEDCGRSWAPQGPLTGSSELPAHLLRLADGRILLTYGIRHRGFYGIGARVSEDGGKQWLSPAVLVGLEDAWDGGYPSSVQLKDGNILTAYYASGVKAHARYHMGVCIWNVDEQWKLNRAPW